MGTAGNAAAAAVGAVSLSITLWVFLPSVVYGLNLGSVKLLRKDLVFGGFASAALSCITLLILSYTPKISLFVQESSQILAVTTFVLVLFPNKTGELTGFERDERDTGRVKWLPFGKPISLIITGAVLALWAPEILVIITIVVLLLSSSASAYMLSRRSPFEQAKNSNKIEPRRVCALGYEENIIVIVLDGFTGYRMAEIFAERPQLRKAFTGFTLYPRAIASALNTPAGIGAILTGNLDVVINYPDTLQRTATLLARSFLADAADKGYETVFVSPLGTDGPQFIQSYQDDYFIGLQQHSPFRNYAGFFGVSLGRILPARLWKFLQAAISEAISGHLSEASTNEEIYATLPPGNEHETFGSKLALAYITENLHRGTFPRKAIFIHSHLSHPPYIFDEIGRYNKHGGWEKTSYFVTDALIRLLNQLRRQGLYDSTLIAVVSDHGNMPVKDASLGGTFPTNQCRFDVQFNPLIMIKPKHANHPLQESRMSVWLGDVAETIRHFLKVPAQVSNSPPVRSLMPPELHDVRELELPIFHRPDQESYHGPLNGWARLDWKGRFAEFGTVCDSSAVPVNVGSRVVVFAGTDKLKTEWVQGGWMEGSGVQYCATIEVDRRVAARIEQSGIVAISGSDGGLRKQEFTDWEQGVQFVQRLDPKDRFIAFGLHVPGAVLQKLFPKAQSQHFKERLANFVYVSDALSRRLEIREDDLKVDIIWR